MDKSELNIRDKRTIEGIIEELQYQLKHTVFNKISLSLSKTQMIIDRLEMIGG